MKLSVVTTLYCSADRVAEIHRRASAVASWVASVSYEIVLVNDGFPDESLKRAVGLTKQDPRVVVQGALLNRPPSGWTSLIVDDHLVHRRRRDLHGHGVFLKRRAYTIVCKVYRREPR